MQQLRVCVCLMIFCLAAPLPGLVTEDTAAANALSGITLISEETGAFQLSPLVDACGISHSYCLPFGMAEVGVYGLNTAVDLKPVTLMFGSSYLDQGDYRWQDLRLGAALGLGNWRIGLAGHLEYEVFSTLQSYHAFSPDLAVGWRKNGWGAELRGLRVGDDGAQYQISASSQVSPELEAAAAWVHQPAGPDMARAATAFRLGKHLKLLSSWQNEPARFGAGIALRYGAGEIAYAVRTHTELSLTHCLDLGFRW